MRAYLLSRSLPFTGRLFPHLFTLSKRKVVDEARRRLLQQHGAAVEGFLPKGALKSKDELEYIRELSRRHSTSKGANR